MGRGGGHRRVLLVAGMATAVALGGCAAERAPDRLRPLGDRPGGRATTTTALAPRSGSPAPATTATTAPTTTPSGAPPGPDGAATAAAAVLDRYDLALTELGRHPDGAADTASAGRLALDAVVPRGSGLSADVVATAAGRARDGIVVQPGPGGRAYRHRVLAAARSADATIGFTWCGWSPGVARRSATGAVVDDGVSHAHGTGLVRTTPAGDVLESLDESDVTVLPAGAPDPCPAEVARADRKSTRLNSSH
jgi:hypothetical protein